MDDSQDVLFRALADRHRRGILGHLCDGPQVAGELARRVGLAPNALSFHLKWLRIAGLVSMRRRGKYLHYHANQESLSAWREQIQALWATAPQIECEEKIVRSTPARTRARDQGNLLPSGYEAASVPSSIQVHGDLASEQLPTELL